MVFCNNCGSENDDYADFCGKCGTKIQPIAQEQPAKGFQEPTQGYQPQSQSYQQPPQDYQQGYSPGVYNVRTGWLTFVVVLYWIGIVFVSIAALLFLIAFPPLGVFFGALAGLMVWLVRELNKYNNTARIIAIVLSSLGALADIANGDVIGLIFAGLVIYALAFYKATVALFQQPYSGQPGPSMEQY